MLSGTAVTSGVGRLFRAFLLSTFLYFPNFLSFFFFH